jgi:hypothetical protein
VTGKAGTAVSTGGRVGAVVAAGPLQAAKNEVKRINGSRDFVLEFIHVFTKMDRDESSLGG